MRLEEAQRVFQDEYPGYGYRGKIEEIRSGFGQLHGNGVYLDHAGATLASSEQLDAMHNLWKRSLFGNPHSVTAGTPSNLIDTHHSALPGTREHVSSKEALNAVRERVLEHFHVTSDEYCVIFTSGATAALKLVGECFPWSGESEFCYLMENHTSVLGIREYAAKCGARVTVLHPHTGSIDEVVNGKGVSTSPACSEDAFSTTAGVLTPPGETLTSSRAKQMPAGHQHSSSSSEKVAYSLFAYPAESNFGGSMYPLDWAKKWQAKSAPGVGAVNSEEQEREDQGQQQECSAQDESEENTSPGGKKKWLVVLDAAKFACTKDLDLSECGADFVCISFYKMFGAPTGLGCLLAKKTSMSLLRKSYYGGGSVASVAASNHFVARRRGVEPEHFEDGTLHFLGIHSLGFGLDALHRLGMSNIEAHTKALADYIRVQMHSLRHASTGSPVVRLYDTRFVNSEKTPCLYSNSDELLSKSLGPTVAFNILRDDGSVVGYSQVQSLASLAGIRIRTGCFCNIGGCQLALNLSSEDVMRHFDAGHVCSDDHDSVDGRPTGAVRISLGYMSTFEDVWKWVEFVREYFTASRLPHPTEISSTKGLAVGESVQIASNTSSYTLSHAFVFPVKSCGGVRVTSEWPLGPKGFLFDREWSIVTPQGTPLNQKRIARMCMIRTGIDLSSNLLTLTVADMPALGELSVPLWSYPSDGDSAGGSTAASVSLKVCATRVDSLLYGDREAKWCSKALGVPCQLARVSPGSSRPVGGISTDGSHQSSIGFANEAPFLVMSLETVRYYCRLRERYTGTGAQGESKLNYDEEEAVGEYLFYILFYCECVCVCLYTLVVLLSAQCCSHLYCLNCSDTYMICKVYSPFRFAPLTILLFIFFPPFQTHSLHVFGPTLSSTVGWLWTN